MDFILSVVVRVVVWLSAFVRPLARLGLCRYETYGKGQPLKILLVGYNGARNTGADEHEEEIRAAIRRQLTDYKERTMAMSRFFETWLKEQFS